MKLKMVPVLVVLASLTACAGVQSSQQRAERAARIEAAAGAPVRYILPIFGSLYAWDAISDHQVVAYATPKRAYLLDLPSCPGIEHTPAIFISSKMGRISVNFDTVTPSTTRVPCHIKQIRPLDIAKLKQANESIKKNVEIRPRVDAKAAKPGS
jgi:hypothetical protein